MTEFESALVIMAFILFAVFIAILFSVVANLIRDRIRKTIEVRNQKNKNGDNLTSGKF